MYQTRRLRATVVQGQAPHLHPRSRGPMCQAWPFIESPIMSRKTRIEETLGAGLAPLHLEVLDESDMHSVPPGAESHFKVLVVSEGFSADRPLARHRRVNNLLAGEFQTGLHALAIHAWTPQEWFARGGIAPASPQCMGGSKAG